MNYIGKILPIDGYYICSNGSFPVNYAISLTHLYQPLIGMQAIMLYQTLMHDEALQDEADAQTHHTLMNYLNIPLDEIYEARLKLEGIGLLKTYEDKDEKQTTYIYMLQPPFAPERFFQDAMLSQLLYHHIGEQKYTSLRHRFSKKTLPLSSARNITASFNDVYQTYSPTMENIVPISNNDEKQGPELIELDFSWIEQMLKQRMIPTKRVLTGYNKRIMQQMMVLYDLEPMEIEKSVLWALTEENELDTEEFKQACHDLFNGKNHGSSVQLMRKIEKSRPDQQVEKPTTKEEQLIHELEHISPKQLLADLSSGNRASEQDMKVIREVMVAQGLPAPVMNVLIHYVLLQSNMKLSKAYLEKIASHWSRANLTSAKEAMAFAKKEKQRYQNQNGTKTKQPYRGRTYNTEKKEVVPDWFKDRKKQQASPVASNSIDVAKEKQAMANFLEKFAREQNK
ncbi:MULTISPECIES: DnaD domain protein [unclassified Virgibacillus]|uniref:replication initiation and membrane attachment family protein n=1 Tax=unclassified Virgibacillus TaxID=2620237 RepID=UPI0024DE43B9|nr:DnaD domain protein [Virgibacillus sp. LDC-1]